MKKITAVIIARKNSKRLPNKMYQKINGKSLIETKISHLLKTNVDEIAVGSDDLKLKKICQKFVCPHFFSKKYIIKNHIFKLF